jgi:hypothetical protein
LTEGVSTAAYRLRMGLGHVNHKCVFTDQLGE